MCLKKLAQKGITSVLVEGGGKIFTEFIKQKLARVYNNQHWFSDVFLGSAIGYFTGVYIVNAHKQH